MTATQDDSQKICRSCLKPKAEHTETTRTMDDVVFVDHQCPDLQWSKFREDYGYWCDDGHTIHAHYHHGNLSAVVTCPGKPQCKAYYQCECEGYDDDCKLCHGTGKDDTYEGCWLVEYGNEIGHQDFLEMCPVRVPFDLKRPIRILWTGGDEPEWRPADINEGA